MRQSLALLALAATLAMPMAHAADIALKPGAVVPKAGYTLGQVAELAGDTPEVLARLAALPLGRSPRVGTTERVSRTALERLVRTQAGEQRLHWSGADAVRIETAATTVSGRDLADRAAQYLERVLSADRQRVAIRPLADTADVQVPQGRVSFRPRPLAYTEALRRHAQVWIDVLVDGAFYRTVAVSFGVEVWREALVARHELTRGDALHCDAFETREVDLAAVGAAVADTPCTGLAGRAGRRIGAGEVLLAAVAQGRTAIAQGDLIVLQVADGGIAIESPAVALADGRVGQRIPVRPQRGTAIVYAEVTATGVTSIRGN